MAEHMKRVMRIYGSQAPKKFLRPNALPNPYSSTVGGSEAKNLTRSTNMSESRDRFKPHDKAYIQRNAKISNSRYETDFPGRNSPPQ